jgi:hypothetical protein
MCTPPDAVVLRLALAYAAGDDDAMAYALHELEKCRDCTIDTILGLTHMCVRLLTQHCGEWEKTMAADLRDMLDMLDPSERPGY